MSAYKFRTGRLQQTAFGSAAPPAAPASPFPYIVPELTQISVRAAGTNGFITKTNAELLQEGDVILVMSAADGAIMASNSEGYTYLVNEDRAVSSDVLMLTVGPTPPTDVLQIANTSLNCANLCVVIRGSRGLRATEGLFIRGTGTTTSLAAVATPTEANEFVISYIAIDDRNGAPTVWPGPDNRLASGVAGGTVAMVSQVADEAGPITWPVPSWGGFGTEPTTGAAFSFLPIIPAATPEVLIILNDTFDANIDGWTDNANSVSTWVATGGGRMRVTKSPSGLFSTWKSFPTTVGKYYTVTATMAAAWNPGWLILSNGSAAYNTGGEIGRPLDNVSSGTGSTTFIGSGNPVYMHAVNSNFTSTWIELDNISVKEIVPVDVFRETFDTDVSNWSANTNAIVTWRSTSGGRMRVQSPTANEGAYLDFPTVSGNNYRLTASIVGRSGGFGYVDIETGAGGFVMRIIDANSNVIGATGEFVGTGQPMKIHCYSYGNFWHEFDDISVIDLGA